MFRQYLKDKPQRALLAAALLVVGAGIGIELGAWMLSGASPEQRPGILKLVFPMRPLPKRAAEPMSFDRLVGLLAGRHGVPEAEAKRFAEEFKEKPELGEVWKDLEENQNIAAFTKKLEKSKSFAELYSSARFSTLAAALASEKEVQAAGESTGFFGLGGGRRTIPWLTGEPGKRPVKVETPGGPLFARAGLSTGGGVTSRPAATGISTEGAGLTEAAPNPLVGQKEGKAGGGVGNSDVPTPTDPGPPGPGNPVPTDSPYPPDPTPDPSPKTHGDTGNNPASYPPSPGSGFELPDISKLLGGMGGKDGESGAQGGGGSGGDGKPRKPRLPQDPNAQTGAAYLRDYSKYLKDSAWRGPLKDCRGCDSKVEDTATDYTNKGISEFKTALPDRKTAAARRQALEISRDRHLEGSSGLKNRLTPRGICGRSVCNLQ